eukprot:TRINITY_DN5087_c0_g1_i1.p1 TRINITY_DN5087_c0_g1~~TRINITY_DN5087_c0_g1_i1.p1  ORF type:complete len:268 (+),score=29.95 TRINITY_DN5087_c0_g1_i1:411-1214(+)
MQTTHHVKMHKKPKTAGAFGKEKKPAPVVAPPTPPAPTRPVRSRVFLVIDLRSRKLRLDFELYGDLAPRTCENFRCLCTGEKGRGQHTEKPLIYKGSVLHRIIPGFMIQGGDFSHANGTGGESIYGKAFDDEAFICKHDHCGLLSMANSGPNTNGSQFFITAAPAPHLDGKHVVFGRLLTPVQVLRDIEAFGSPDGTPKGRVMISDCGEVPVGQYNDPQRNPYSHGAAQAAAQMAQNLYAPAQSMMAQNAFAPVSYTHLTLPTKRIV